MLCLAWLSMNSRVDFLSGGIGGPVDERQIGATKTRGGVSPLTAGMRASVSSNFLKVAAIP